MNSTAARDGGSNMATRMQTLRALGHAFMCPCGKLIKAQGLSSHVRGAQHQRWWDDYKHFMDRVGRAVNAA